jgi:TonB-linked SusC/RagA family outer membrane protein
MTRSSYAHFPKGLGRLALAGALALALGWAPSAVSAQTGTVVGTVTESGGLRALESVQVFIPGTGIGTLTNTAGRYLLLNVPTGQVTVRAEIVGYRAAETTVTVTADESVVADLSLAQTAIALDEVVVTGAGQATEIRMLGNTIATISSDDLEQKPITSLSEILTGREPGMVGLPTSGLTGEGAQIRIRGSSSLSQSNEPIIYVDGVRVDRSGGFGQGIGQGTAGAPSRLDDINPDAIERVEILKGAAAATLYGSEASNGVIQIFTKSGTTGEPSWTYTGEVGAVNYPGGVIPPNAGFARDDEQLQNMRALYNAPSLQLYEPLVVPIFEDWGFETGTYTTQALSVSGGTSAVTYFLSGRYQYENGPMGGTDRCEVGCAEDTNQRVQGSATINVFPTDKLRVRTSVNYSQVDHSTIENGNNIFGVNALLMFAQPQRGNCDQSAIAGYLRCTGAGNPTGQAAFMTPQEAIQQETTQDAQHFTGSLGADYAFSDSWNANLTFGVDFVNQFSTNFAPFGYAVDNFTTNNVDGQRSINDTNRRQITMDGKVNWNTTFGSRWTSGLTVGGQGFIEEVQEGWGSGQIFPGPGLEVVTATSLPLANEEFRQVVNAGFFGQWQVGFDDWIFATVGGRQDYNSAFGETESGQFYPKGSISIVPSSRPSWTSQTLSTFRVRAAIGKSGLQPGAFDKFTTFESQGSEIGPGVAPDNLGNENLRPEISTEWEFGAEFGLFNDVLSFDGTYWNRTVKDALVAKQFPLTGGFRNAQLDNIGEMTAWGLELQANWIAIEGSDRFNMDMFANAAYITEEINDMGGAPPIKVGGSYTRYRNFLDEGLPPGAHLGAKLLSVPDGSLPVDLNNDGTPDTRDQLLQILEDPVPFSEITFKNNTGGLMLVDEDGDGDFLDHFLGKPTPDWQGSLGLNIGFLSNFRLSTMFEYRTGDYWRNNLTGAFRQSNATIGRNLEQTATAESNMMNPASTPESRLEALETWVFELSALFPQSGLNTIKSANFTRWRELALTYTLPRSALFWNIDGLSFTLTGRNIAIWTGYDGVDPEAGLFSRGEQPNNAENQNFGVSIEAFSQPLPRRWGLQARLNF